MCMNICESPQSSFYNEDLLPPNAFALSSRKKKIVLKRFFKISVDFISFLGKFI